MAVDTPTVHGVYALHSGGCLVIGNGDVVSRYKIIRKVARGSEERYDVGSG